MPETKEYTQFSSKLGLGKVRAPQASTKKQTKKKNKNKQKIALKKTMKMNTFMKKKKKTKNAIQIAMERRHLTYKRLLLAEITSIWI